MLYVLAAAPLFAAVCVDGSDLLYVGAVGVLLVLVGIGCLFLVSAGVYSSAMERLLEEGDYARGQKKHRRVLYTNLKTSGKLAEHLAEIEQTARKMVEQTVAQMAKAEGVTEALKATDPLRWTGLMNNLRHSAEELVLSDLIYN